MRNKYIELAINKLGIAFNSLDLTFHQIIPVCPEMSPLTGLVRMMRMC